MSKPLTLRNREDKGDIDRAFEAAFLRRLNSLFPSYFDDFRLFSRFSAIRIEAWSRRLRFNRKHEIAPAAAIMAIV
jgi:hypothetical protein